MPVSFPPGRRGREKAVKTLCINITHHTSGERESEGGGRGGSEGGVGGREGGSE